jgi:hypothetical protein
VSESPETTPLSAAAKALAVAITGNPDEVPTPLERERAEAVVRAYDAARATVPADHLRREVERILGNGPMWASDYAYEVLEAALAARPVPAADDRLREAAQRVVAAKPVRWNDRPADSFIEAVGVLRTTLDAARATVPAGPFVDAAEALGVEDGTGWVADRPVPAADDRERRLKAIHDHAWNTDSEGHTWEVDGCGECKWHRDLLAGVSPSTGDDR